MASATGIPESNPATNEGSREDEPLLGQPGDASQPYQKGLEFNLILGTETTTHKPLSLLKPSLTAFKSARFLLAD